MIQSLEISSNQIVIIIIIIIFVLNIQLMVTLYFDGPLCTFYYVTISNFATTCQIILLT